MTLYFKFRYTFPPDVNLIHYINCVDTIFLDKLKPVNHVMGIETMNKFGETVKTHIHIHFSTQDSKANIRARFVRYLKALAKQEGEAYKGGNELYHLKDNAIDDYDRFFRYPLKQNGRELDKSQNPPEGFDLEEQRLIAYAEWKRDIDFNKIKREREAAKQSVYDKLEVVLDEQVKTDDIEFIRDCVIDYYKEKKLSANFKTMEGYVNTYRLLKGWMSKVEARAHMKKHS